MSYIAAEDVAKAKEMDLLTYLRNYEPQELVHVSGSTYCTREHDSLRISNGKWCWFSQGIGGRSALDYLIKVKGIPFTQAAEIILGREAEKPPVFYRQKERRSTELLMPELSETTDRVEKYLQGRGIHPVIIRYCLDNRLLFESADFHSAVLVGYDKDGKARYGALRSTVSSYKGELTGSDKHFSFFLEGKPNAEHIHVFESAIDLLSFATLALLAGHDWKSETYLSLAGVFQTKRENVVPVALSRFLDEHPSVRKIHLHLDNDAVGRGAVKGIVGGLQGRYQVYDEPPSRGKDVNDELKIRVGLKLSKQNVILYLCGIIPVVWLGLLIAPCLKDGLPGLVQQFGSVMQNPFQIQLCEDSVKTVLTLLLVYGIAIGVYLSAEHNYRRREEHGSAKWGTAGSVNKKYANKDKTENKLLTQNVAIGLDGRKHRRNLNVLVCGGSGAGKTRFYAKPNIMNANTSFVVLDPKGELLRDTGHLLEEKGYEIKVLDLIDMEKSHCYNPFVYLRNDNDIQRLVTNLFKSTTPKGSQSNDPFWDTAASMLLLALIFYLHYEAPEEEQNFAMVMEMLRAAAIEDEEDNRPSPLDNLFADLEMDNPEHIALKYYRSYHSGSAKTLKSIQITLAARLEKFNLESLAALTSADELDLASMGEKKTALFALIPDNDSSFNFLVSILYTQLFQQLFYSADHIHGGSLPIPVHFLMDEFANVSLPDDFDKILSVMRSRGVSVSIILQNLAQLKALFEKQWESIVGNCDEFLYLGGNEQSTHKYVSELLGKETIDTNTYGKSEGRSGSYSTNYQISGRELLTPDEVRMLDNRYAILFIRGELPVMDLKYDILKHPNVAYTADGKGGVYQHGEVTKNVATIETLYVDLDSVPEMELSETTYELLSDEDFENLTN